MNLSGIRDVNELKRLLAAGQISQDDLNNTTLSGSFGPSDQLPPPQQMPVQGTQNALQDMVNPGPQLGPPANLNGLPARFASGIALAKFVNGDNVDDGGAQSQQPQTAQQQPPQGSNYVRNEQTGHITYLTPQGLSDTPSMGAVIQHSPGGGAPSGGSAYTGSTQMMPQRQDPNAPAVTRVLGSGNGTTVDLGAAQQGETSRPQLASGRNPIDIPGAGRGYYGTDGNAYVPNGDGSWTKVVLGYDMQGSMALNKANTELAKDQAQIAQTQAATTHTQEETRASRVNNPDWLGLDSGGGAPNGAGGAPGSPAGIDLSKVPPGILQQAQAMANGDMQLPMTRNGKLNPIAALAFQINPNLKQTDYVQKQATVKDFAPNGIDGQKVKQVNQALHHAGLLLDTIGDLNNFDVAPGIINPIKNTLGPMLSGADVAPGVYKQTADALSLEVRKVYAGAGGGTEGELRDWQASFNPNAGPTQQRAYLKRGMDLLRGGIQALQSSYSRGMGPSANFGNLLDDNARAGLAKITQAGLDPGIGDIVGVNQSASAAQAPQTQNAPRANSNIPPQAVAFLRSNPASRFDFDRKYGQGASAQVLGQ